MFTNFSTFIFTKISTIEKANFGPKVKIEKVNLTTWQLQENDLRRPLPF